MTDRTDREPMRGGWGGRVVSGAGLFAVALLFRLLPAPTVLLANGVQPFGGFNMSGSNSKAGGPDYLRLFMEMKTVAQAGG